MNKHTQGEWSLPHFADPEVGCNCKYVLSDNFAGSICEVTVDNGLSIHDGGNDGPSMGEAIANARLIASAPDMLRILQFCHAWLQGSDPHRAKAVGECIAKATGGRLP